MKTMSLSIYQLSYVHNDGQTLFRNISFSLSDGQKTSLIGENGSGKSTLLKLIAGKLKATSGEICYNEIPYYVPQHFGQYGHLTIAEALGISDKIEALHAILNGEVSEHLFTTLNDDWNVEEKAIMALREWNLNHIGLSTSMDLLSGGEKSKVFLAGISIHSPKIILLDEPTNHLDKKSREQLYDYLKKIRATILIVSHDRTLLNQMNYTYELHKDKIESYGGNYDFYKACKTEQINALQEQLDEKEKEIRKAKKIARETIERQEKHSVRGKKINEKKGIPRIMMNNLKNKSENSAARLQDTLSEKTHTLIQDLKEIQNKIPTHNELKIKFENAIIHFGKELITANDLNFGYNNKPLWKQNLNFMIRSGDRIAINGTNGSGKTTLIKLILGDLQPTLGNITRGTFNKLYIDQEYSIIDNKLNILDQIQKYNNCHYTDSELKTILHRFLFPAHSWDKSCEKLSGGEKMKLIFCCLQVSNQSPDIFILDEPTNNLDIQSLEIVTSVIRSYEGTLIVISHDDYFIKEIGITQTIELS